MNPISEQIFSHFFELSYVQIFTYMPKVYCVNINLQMYTGRVTDSTGIYKQNKLKIASYNWTFPDLTASWSGIHNSCQ